MQTLIVNRSARPFVQLTFADKSEYAGEFIDGMNSGYGVLTFGDQVSLGNP